MKKILLASTMVFGVLFGLLGKASITSAAVATVSAGATQTITLPTSTATLTGTATATSGSSIVGYNWVETSGPATATITTPTLASTGISGLTAAGSYVFTLTATDNTSPTAMTGSSSVTVTVNAAPAVTVSAGPAQTIVLPTTTTTLNGNATTSVSGSSIANYAWTQVSGPATAIMSTPTAASTSVVGLTAAGAYVFRLTAIDTTTPSALTSSADVVITVTSATTTPTPKKIKTNLEINPKGGVTLSGELVSNSNGVLTVKVWGITFTVNTASANSGASATNPSTYAVGDIIGVNGKLDATASVPTIKARTVRDLTAQAAAAQLKKQKKSQKESFANGHDNRSANKDEKGNGDN